MSVRCHICHGTWPTVELAQRAHAQADVCAATRYHEFMPDEALDQAMSDATARAAATLGSGVVGMLAWTDPTGQWWMAPLGSQPPGSVPDGLSPAWLPIDIKHRADLI